MFTAMNRMRQDMIDVIFDSVPPAKAKEMCGSLSKIADLDLVAMTSAYMGGHELGAAAHPPGSDHPQYADHSALFERPGSSR
ncbi:MAG: hypothetical protein ACI9VR_003808 [Cognaticolwellia sp.]|jgi:hypothetical protein